MTIQDLHTHTLFDDGKNTPAQMAQAALDAGFSSLGFSGHSILPYENDWSMTEASFAAYTAAVRQVQQDYAGRLPIYYGLEWDILSPQRPEGFDYVIGSVHHLSMDGETPSIDESGPLSRDILTRFFHGDSDRMARAYFAQYESLARTPAVDIVGHFDLLSKFSQTDGLFPLDTPVCRDSAMAALELLVKADKLFEVNTGAMSRGYRTDPYPADWLLRELRARNARLVLSSDAHAVTGLGYAFPQTIDRLRAIGFCELWQYTPQGFWAYSI
jgi:histidinol-phosphatase (PHP family)